LRFEFLVFINILIQDYIFFIIVSEGKEEKFIFLL